MSKEIIDEVLALAGQIEDQLKFYREIGLEDIGNEARDAETAPPSLESVSTSVASPAVQPRPQAPADVPQPQSSESTPRTISQMQEAALFDEMSGTVNPARSRTRTASIPIIESRDASLEAIREDIGDCRRCRLCEHRTNIVFGEGNPQAKLMFVGEGPGAGEDTDGRAFVGRAGQLLDKIIEAIGMKREEVYIANIVKCRPPGNRAPEQDEVDTCEPFLWRQLTFIHPEVIVALGSPAFQCLLRTREPITRARGEWRDWNGIKLMPTFHP